MSAAGILVRPFGKTSEAGLKNHGMFWERNLAITQPPLQDSDYSLELGLAFVPDSVLIVLLAARAYFPRDFVPWFLEVFSSH